MISDFLCVCQLPSRFTTQCHASTCHVVCGYMIYMHWDGAYSLDFALGGFRDSRETGPPSISAQQLKAELQEADSSEELAMTLRNALHDSHDIMTLQIFRSKSWLPHLALISFVFAVKSPTLEFLWISQLLNSLLLKTLSEFSKHWLPLLQLHRPFRSWVLPHSEGTQPSRSKELMETANDLQIVATRWKKMHISACIASASLVFLDNSAAWLELRWLHTKCQRMSKTRYTKEKNSWRMRPESQKSRYGMVWIHIIIIHNTYCAYHFLPLWQPFCLPNSFWPARALDLMLAASAALRRQNVRPQKVERRHIASSKCKRKKGRMQLTIINIHTLHIIHVECTKSNTATVLA